MLVYNVSYERKDTFDIHSNQIIVPIFTIDNTRNPIKRFPLILDTGAFITLIKKDKKR